MTARCQAITDIIQSVAMQETALSHILNAEGEKIQKFVSIDDIRSDQLLMLNDSVKSLVRISCKVRICSTGKTSKHISYRLLRLNNNDYKVY